MRLMPYAIQILMSILTVQGNAFYISSFLLDSLPNHGGYAWCNNSCYRIFQDGGGPKRSINKASTVYSIHLTTDLNVPIC